MKIDEYIKKRISDDQVNIMDLKDKDRNLQLCLNYIFDYFNTYVTADVLQKKIITDNVKLEKYSNSIREYSNDTKLWLTDMFVKYNKRMNTVIWNVLKSNDLFLLMNTESEFRKVSYQCYSKLIKKHPFLEDYIEELYKCILDIHRIKSLDYSFECENQYRFVSFNEKIDKYVRDILKNENVNLLAWAELYAEYFSDSKHLWPTYTIVKQNYGEEYDISKAKNNYFNIDTLYSKISTYKYLRGKKKILEILVMYYWAHYIMGIEDDDFYKEYMRKNVEEK